MAKRHTPIIGKNIIESLTLGMYENSLCIYREYIQNSADAIDKALALSIFSSDDQPAIMIQADDSKREIVISDNGIGVKESTAYETLTDIAASTKIIGKDKGFRGIGRLAGLAYCEKLLFETSSAGEAIRSVLEWDAKQLRVLIADRKTTEHASEVIKKITSYRTEKESADAHYFKVTLCGVTDAKLLDDSSIRGYLNFVAPVRYRSGFIFHSNIKQYAKENAYKIDEYCIFINEKPVEKLYQTYLYTEKNDKKERYDDIRDIVFISDIAPDGLPLYWGWYSLTALEKQIPSCNPGRSIRLRKENIQIGENDTLRRFFNETRGNSYFLGEVFAVHKDLIPNSQRSFFNENFRFEIGHSLKKKFDELYSLYHLSNTARGNFKKINNLISVKKEYAEKRKEGFSGKEEATTLQADIDAKSKEALGAENSLTNLYEKYQPDTTAGKLLSIIKEKFDVKKSTGKTKEDITPPATKLKFRSDKHTHLKKQERKLVSMIYEVINNVLPKELASNLIEKIDETLSQ